MKDRDSGQQQPRVRPRRVPGFVYPAAFVLGLCAVSSSGCAPVNAESKSTSPDGPGPTPITVKQPESTATAQLVVSSSPEPPKSTPLTPQERETMIGQIDEIIALLKSLGNFENYFEDIHGGDVGIGRGRVQMIIGGNNPDFKYNGSNQVLRDTPMEKGLLGVAKEKLQAGDTKTAATLLDWAESEFTAWRHPNYPALTPDDTTGGKFGRWGKASGGVINIPPYAEAYFKTVTLLEKLQEPTK